MASAIKVTAIFVFIAVPIELCLGFFIAVLFNRPLMGRSALRAIMILPIFATPIAMAYSFFTIFYEEGGPLSFTGIPWLSNPHWALFSVAVVDIWQWTPFCFLVLLAALQGVPDELLEAARIDGASSTDILVRILLPLLQPTIIIVLLLRIAEAVKLFDIPFALTGGGPGVATQSPLVPGFPYRIAFLRPGLCQCDGLHAARCRHGRRLAVLPAIEANLWVIAVPQPICAGRSSRWSRSR